MASLVIATALRRNVVRLYELRREDLKSTYDNQQGPSLNVLMLRVIAHLRGCGADVVVRVLCAVTALMTCDRCHRCVPVSQNRPLGRSPLILHAIT